MSVADVLRRAGFVPRVPPHLSDGGAVQSEQTRAVPLAPPVPPQNEQSDGEHQALDPGRLCWPNSTAWNPGEVDTFLRRVALFTEHGLDPRAAEALAESLVLRDRDFDERIVCLECAHYLRGCCTNWKAAGYVRAEHAVLGECGRMLKRCAAFAKAADAEVGGAAT